MHFATMVRKQIGFRIDERVIEALKTQVVSTGGTTNNWVETLFIETLKRTGALPQDFEPLGETRGGDRTKGSSPDG
ncbi:MAG: hypothetical protein AAGJ95_10405 [Cyanobacteria bacterium J06554_11]